MTFLPSIRLLTLVLPLVWSAAMAAPPESEFQKIVLNERFYSEGATFADINGDGEQDIVSGPFWYEGPEFQKQHSYTSSGPFAISGYSSHFFTFAADFNKDTYPDILAIPMPGEAAHWFENPGDENGEWKKHLALNEVSNESPIFADVTGDGQPELICISGGAYGYTKLPADSPDQPWQFVAITPNRGLGRFTHGMGIGDVNGDGRPDLLETSGWWEQTETSGELFRHHAYPFAQAGGSQMFAYDFDGDGDNDVVSVQNAHGWGLKWFEQRGADGDVGFVAHDILPDKYVAEAPLNISQMHALALADIDNDGIKDIVTGKRFYAHGGGDPGAHQLPVLYWLRTVRGTPEGVSFQPHLIDQRTGVGTQLTVGDLTGDQKPDIVVGNKLGTFVLINRGESVSPPPVMSTASKFIGTDEYAQAIRNVEPLTPEGEAATFVLPDGFTAQLVVSEPEIAKPMNMAFDSRGRLWVTTSEEYPYAAPLDKEGRDRIVVLEDRDGDGHRETVTTFADGLNIPIGLYPYKDGVICFSIPNIWHLQDTDGDGRCDRRTVLYGPMGYERDTHGMCNGFTRGFDGWLYACHGFNNHTTVSGADGHQVTMQSGNTFRMRLDGSRVEHFTHGLVNPFGMNQTPYGDLLVADCHTKPVTLLLPDGYYDSFGKPHDGLGFVPNVMEHLHGSTAIGGIAQYNTNNFPAVYWGNLFGGNVMTSRVNRNSLQQHGGSYRVVEEPDFLVSGDPWFRPVDLEVGPDGALYVADFYNRIIGHYEVKLDHPGRDRHRGRIWRITYNNDSSRRDAGSTLQPALPALQQDAESLFAQLASADLQRRMLATDQLTDSHAEQAVALAQKGVTADEPTVRAHSLWILQRLGKLSDEQLTHAVEDSDELVRNHAFRILMDRATPAENTADLLLRGMNDSSSLVRRAAVHAAAKHRLPAIIRPLIELFHATPEQDLHLRHSIRMALRDQLLDADTFESVASNLPDGDVRLIAGICLSLNSTPAGDFIVSHLDSLSGENPETFASFIQFAVRYVSPQMVDQLTNVARRRFVDDSDFQLKLLQAAQEGLSQRGAAIPPAIEQWATALAENLLEIKDGQLPPPGSAPISWVYVPHPDFSDEGNPFAATYTRRCTDGMQNTPLISSIPRGERLTGIYRSDAFTIEGEFRFFMCGHRGFPPEPAHDKNFVRLRDAATHETLQTWYPPRNDTAHPYEWTEQRSDSRRVYLEIVDGDTERAYAWLAAGRFSVPGLNPSTSTEKRQQGIKLVGDFGLQQLRPALCELLRRNISDLPAASRIAQTLARLSPSSRALALYASVGTVGMTQEQTMATFDALINRADESTGELLGTIMKVATSAEQFRIAQALTADAGGLDLLLSLVEKGQASAELLRRPVIADAIKAVGNQEVSSRMEMLTKSLPDQNAAILKLIETRQQQYRQNPGTAVAGAELFTKNCAVCHQIGGKGKKVGPNLDGIGKRGLDRLVEDILDPNRNVDVAFRSTTVVMTSGKVASGLSKGFDGERLLLINNKGEEVSVARSDIEEQVVSPRSPMPGNVGEILTEQQFRDLLAWLLTQS